METSCPFCQKPKATLQCGACESVVCKNCAQFLEPETFSFRPTLPDDLKHSTYCPSCFTAKVDPEIAAYNEDLQKAENVFIFYKKESKETRLFSRHAKPIKVKDCKDKDEAILRLAFLAANAKFNTIIDVDLISEKVKVGGYQTMKWSGTAIPVNVEERRLNRK